MNVTQEQLDSYLRNGFLLIEDVFKKNEVNIILDAINFHNYISFFARNF